MDIYLMTKNNFEEHQIHELTGDINVGIILNVINYFKYLLAISMKFYIHNCRMKSEMVDVSL